MIIECVRLSVHTKKNTVRDLRVVAEIVCECIGCAVGDLASYVCREEPEPRAVVSVSGPVTQEQCARIMEQIQATEWDGPMPEMEYDEDCDEEYE